MFGKVKKTRYTEEKYVDHYIKLLINNSEVTDMLEKRNVPKSCILDPIDLDNCCVDREYRYHDRHGNYWDNWIGKETIIDL